MMDTDGVENANTWEQLLTPAIMQERLIFASLFITAFEILRESIVGRVRSFYMIGVDGGSAVIDKKYDEIVLSRNKSPVYASLDWLTDYDIVDGTDLAAFERVKATRNSLAHELPLLVLHGKDFSLKTRFDELVDLLKKIETWWLVNFEIPINPDFEGKEIDESGIVPGPVLMIRLMLEVISGNEDLLTQYRSKRG